MSTIIRPAIVMFAALTVICGVVYPYAVTGIGQLAFSDQANGSMVENGGKVIGSSLIGQSFTSPKYFWGRPSATTPMANNGAGSGGSNLGPTNPALLDAVKGRIDALKAADPENRLPVPVDLVTASGSGLDPEISIAAARYQAPRVARERHVSPEQVQDIVTHYQQQSLFGFFGEPRVNVLALNMALDALPK
ncbi:potassium-transporting ATPase subunit KdpC [Janthinobacterium agaricidamnosum]|uniref:Potassium-transporting ATPase KdpC subunit n=1 Tax=Janthinobacterium agaricidamnosum NBRC 102515 = DSM 9628 TaxID=1349767 RepID=W0V1Z2_9BURK|nr:potassium-transporting ATPase subunit KdpC [Janthinobacterium agaricidamnosum]CDG81353.1 K+-transporting ATPase, C subunit [Janthinobacterium agaricidamnosum NBRC 102515 = DSM 9628]